MQAKSNELIYLQILNMFVSDDGDSPELSTPFRIGNFVISTDRHCLCFFNKNYTPSVKAYYGDIKQENIRAVIPSKRNQNFEISIETLKDAIAKCPLVDEMKTINKGKQCDCCKGEGSVMFEFSYKNHTYSNEEECPICNGDGSLEKEVPTGNNIPFLEGGIKIKKSILKAEFLQKLLKIAELLNESKIVLTYQVKKDNASIFKIGDVQVLLMPLVLWSELVNIELVAEIS